KEVCVDHSLLRDPFVCRALDLINRGKIGTVFAVDYFRSQVYDPYMGGPLPEQYRDGGFPFRDIGVHALYLMGAFLGEIREVSASFEKRGNDPSLHFDEWRTLVHCTQGIGHIHLTWNVKPLQNLLRVQGSRGVIEADLFG